jgi:hydrogenase-4 component F
MTEFLAIAMVLAPSLGAVGAWVAGKRGDARLAMAAGIGASAVSLLAAATLAILVFANGTASAFDGLVTVDALGAFALLLVASVGSIAVAASPAYLARHRAAGLPPLEEGTYWALLVLFAGGLALVPMLNNLGLVWVGIEATTVVSAMLVGFTRSPGAIEAAWKYLILGSIGIGFALLGTMLVYAAAGENPAVGNALAWTDLTRSASVLDPELLRLGFLFALVGFGTKVGLAPFHTWLPDAHSQAPAPISALLSGAGLAVALYALARFHLISAAGLGPAFSSTLLVAFGLLSLAVSLPFIVAQGDLKRLFAYSSIEHLGLATLALGFGGHLALAGFTLHLFCHGLTKAAAFVAAGRLVEEAESHRIGRLGGSLTRSPAAARTLVGASLLLSGLPPSGIFVAELAILFGGVAAGWTIAAAVAAAILALAVAGLLFHVSRVAVGPDRVRGARVSVRGRTVALLGAPLAVVAVAGLWTPTPIADAVNQIVAILGGGRG